MHISEGVLSVTLQGQAVLLAGGVLAAVGTAVGLRRLDYHRVPQAGVLSAAFFVISLVQVSVGQASVHLMLTGLMGLVLGWAAFPAVLVALLLQAVFAGVGGLTTLGLNTVVMALPAVVCRYLFCLPVRSDRPWLTFSGGFAAGAVAIVLSSGLSFAAYKVSGRQFLLLGISAVVGHLPVALIEGLVTGSIVVLLQKVRPEVLDWSLAAALRPET